MLGDVYMIEITRVDGGMKVVDTSYPDVRLETFVPKGRVYDSADAWRKHQGLPEPTRARREATEARRKGLGDHVESALESVGITMDRWIAFKKVFGGGPGCNCPARKAWLNKLGEQLGDAARDAVEGLRRPART
jgi:hypothetical protein